MPDDGILQDRYCFLIQPSLHCSLKGQVSWLSHLLSWKGLFFHIFVFKIYICQNGVTSPVSVPVPSITLIHNLTSKSTNLDPEKDDREVPLKYKTIWCHNPQDLHLVHIIKSTFVS